MGSTSDFVRKPFRESEIFKTMSKHLGVRFVYGEALPVNQTPTLLQLNSSQWLI